MKTVSLRTLGDLGPQQGAAVRIDGYPGRSRVFHTIALRSLSYIGDVNVEMSMAVDPNEEDWKLIHTLSFGSAPLTVAANITGKFIWVRLRYDGAIMGKLDIGIVR